MSTARVFAVRVALAVAALSASLIFGQNGHSPLAEAGEETEAQRHADWRRSLARDFRRGIPAKDVLEEHNGKAMGILRDIHATPEAPDAPRRAQLREIGQRLVHLADTSFLAGHVSADEWREARGHHSGFLVGLGRGEDGQLRFERRVLYILAERSLERTQRAAGR